MKELENKLKELEEQKINLMDLDILQELNYQSKYYLEVELTEEEKEEVFYQVRRAYLKSEDLPIHVITTTALDNLEELKNMSTWDLIEEASFNY